MWTTAASPPRREPSLIIAALTTALVGFALLLALSSAAHAADSPAGVVTQLPGTAGCTSDSGTGGSCVDGDTLDYARGIATSLDGLHVYVASYVDDAVLVYTRDAATGALTQTSCVQNTGAGTCSDGTALNGA